MYQSTCELHPQLMVTLEKENTRWLIRKHPSRTRRTDILIIMRGQDTQHSHGTLDPSTVTTQRGLWAVKWSFIGLLFTALIQAVIVWMSGSVALLADTIHNVGDAVTALPLGIAFVLARRPPSPRFTYGLGRAEDLAGVVIVGSHRRECPGCRL